MGVGYKYYLLLTWLCRVLDHGRTIPGTVKGKKIMKVYVSDGRSEALVGKCIFFLREKREEVNASNVMVDHFSSSAAPMIWLRRCVNVNPISITPTCS